VCGRKVGASLSRSKDRVEARIRSRLPIRLERRRDAYGLRDHRRETLYRSRKILVGLTCSVHVSDPEIFKVDRLRPRYWIG